MKHIFKRTAAAILSLVIVISACSGIISTFAVSGHDSTFSFNLEANDKTDNIPTKSSVVKSAEYRLKEWNYPYDVVKNLDATYFPMLKDNKADKIEFWGISFANNWNRDFMFYRDGVNQYFDIIYTLDGVCDVSDILVMNVPDEFWWISYDIYASNQRDTLFSDKPILTYDNTGAKTRTQRFKTTNLKAKYVAMRVTASTSDADADTPSNPEYASQTWQERFRVSEFNVYGTKVTDYGKPSEGDELAYPASPARPVVKEAYAQYSNGSQTTSATLNLGENLSDGNNGATATVSVTDSPFYKDTDNGGSGSGSGSGGESQVSLPSGVHTTNATGRHKVELGYWGNMYGTYYVDHGTVLNKSAQDAIINYTIANNPAFSDGRGFGINWSKPTPANATTTITQDTTWSTGWATFRVRFYGLGGKLIKEQWVDNKGVPTVPTADELKELGYTFIGWDKEISTCVESKLDYTAKYEKFKYVDVVLKLKGQQTINDIYVAHDTNANYIPRKYHIYIGNSEKDLFEGDPYYTYSKDNPKATQHYELDNYVGSYVGLRIEKPHADSVAEADSLVRLREFNVYTDRAYEKVRQINNDNYLMDLPKGTSVVNSVEAYYKNAGAGREETAVTTVSSSDKTPLEALVDGAFDTRLRLKDGGFAEGSATPTKIHLNDGEAYGDIIYTLDGNCDIDYIVVAGRNAEDRRWNLSYELYASDDKATLFDTPIYTFKNTKETCSYAYACEGLTAKYVAMRITGITTHNNVNSADFKEEKVSGFIAQITEFNVIGDPDMSVRAPAEEGSNVDFPTDESMVNSVNAYYFDVENRKTTPITDAEKLYDSSLSGVASTKDAAMNVIGAYTDIVLEFKREGVISDIYIANADDSKYYAKEYSIYISNNKDKLFDKVYYTYKSDSPTRIQRYEISALLARAKYVGIRVKEAHASGVSKENSYARFAEINVYGSIDPFKKVTNYVNQQIPEGVDLSQYTNLTHPDTKVQPTVQGYEKTADGAKKINTTFLETDYASKKNLADGDLTSQYSVNQPHFAKYDDQIKGVVNYIETESRYVDVYYDLMGVAELDYIIVSSLNTLSQITGKFEIYFSKERKELYTGEPYVTVDNAEEYKKSGVANKLHVIAFDKTDDVAEEARYIGIRIYNPVLDEVGAGNATNVVDPITGIPYAYNPVHVRLGEFAVYGEYLEEDFVPADHLPFIDTKNIDVTKIDETYGPNLLKADKLTTYVDGVGHENTYIAKLTADFGNEVLRRSGDSYANISGNFPASNFTKPGKTVDFVIALDEWELTQVNGFIFESANKGGSNNWTSEYKVWVAEEKEDLFQGEPNFDYNEDKYILTQGQLVAFPEGEQPVGRYFGFRITNTMNGEEPYMSQYLRCSILYAWGEEEEVISYPANAAENMPADVSLIDGNKREPVTDKNLTVEEQKNLTDSKVAVAKDQSKVYTSLTNTYGTIQTKGKDLELVYNLCGEIDVSKLAVTALIDSNNGFKNLKVYASTDLNSVYKKSSLVWSQKVGSKTGKITLEKALSKVTTMRYVRFVFEDTKDNVRIFTLDVIGPDTQRMPTRNVTTGLDQYAVSIYKNDLETGKSEEHFLYPTLYNNLLDNNASSFATLTEGLVGQHTFDMTLNLRDLKTVSSVQLTYPSNYERGWPKKVNVYIGETKAEAETKTTPDLVFKDSEIKNYVLSKSIKPRLARYVRFEFVEFREVPFYIDRETGKYIITSAISDIKVMGTKVVGTQTALDNDILKTYTDKKTGITLDVSRLDQNDIMAGVVGIRVTPEKATNWQMKSLSNNPYYKVIDKTVYKLEFIDVFGNPVSSVGGRSIKLSVKAPVGDYVGLTLANANDRTKLGILDTAEEGGVLSTSYTFNENGDNKIAVLSMTSEDDPYWSTIGELEDFSEGSEDDLMGHDAEWYKSIHTTDGRFTVTPLLYEIETGVRFTATDVSAEIAETEYENILINTPEKSVAVFYDMQITQDGSLLNDGNAYEIAMVLPQEIRDNYSDYEVYYSDGFGGVSALYSEEWNGVLTFQTMSLGNIAIVGTAGNDVLNNSFNVESGIDVSAPVDTGESTATATAVIMLLTAAAFVVGITAKKSAAKK